MVVMGAGRSGPMQSANRKPAARLTTAFHAVTATVQSPAPLFPPGSCLHSALRTSMSPASRDDSSATSVFQIPDFRFLLASIACSTLAGQALAMVVDYQVYDLTKSPLALGILGLVEAIPALSLALYGGHVADRYERSRILQITLAILALATGCLAGWLSFAQQNLV